MDTKGFPLHIPYVSQGALRKSELDLQQCAVSASHSHMHVHQLCEAIEGAGIEHPFSVLTPMQLLSLRICPVKSACVSPPSPLRSAEHQPKALSSPRLWTC